MKDTAWMIPGVRGASREIRVERRPPHGQDRAHDVAQGEYFALGQQYRLEMLPYLRALVGEEAAASVAMALRGDDLVLLGFGRFEGLLQHDAAEALLAEALKVAEETERRSVIVPVTNGDLMALLYLQAAGFRLDAMNPWTGPDRPGVAGIPATQELLCVRVTG